MVARLARTSRILVAVNPTVSGSGVNIKLVEYLSVGLPVVSTSKGQAGVGLTPGVDLRVADDPANFAEQVNHLLASPGDAERLGASGLATATRILDVRASLATMADLMDRPPAGAR